MKFSKISISGKICTGKTTLFNNLQKELAWRSFSTGQFFRDYAKKHQFSLEKAEEQNNILTKKVDYRVKNILRSKKKIIVEGWMAGIMSHHFPEVLRILLTCDDKIRIKRFSQREKLGLKKSQKKIIEREKNLLGKLSKIYKRDDFFDPRFYNLIIDTSNLTEKNILNQVLKFLRN